MRDLDSVFEEALLDGHTGVLDNKGVEARILLGIKIVRDEDGIRFYDTTKGGDTYAEFTQHEYATMCVYGWREGLIRVKMENYKRRMELVEARIRMSLLEQHSSKHIGMLKNRRQQLTMSYADASRQLNIISHADNN